jgi:lipid-binding SYLF domain-containing protein
MRLFSVVIAFMLVAVVPVHAQQIDEKIADRLWESSKILDELIQAPDSAIAKELLTRAECVAIIPAVKRAALGFGGRYGRGVASCRRDGGKGAWGAPSMLALSGGSFGLQLGGQSTDVVMLFMTPGSMKHLLNDKVTLGADASVAAGPKGRAAAADTSASMRAEILTYARSRGLFAGIALNGAVLRPDKDANRELYSRSVEAQELLVEGNTPIPEPAQKLLDTIVRVSSGS